MDSHKKLIDSFLYNLKALVKTIHDHVGDDAKFARLHKRVNIVIEIDPLRVFQTTGEILLNFKNFVYDEETENDMLDHDYSNETDSDEIILLISKIKEIIKSSNAANKQKFRAMLILLLDTYIDYKCLDIED